MAIQWGAQILNLFGIQMIKSSSDVDCLELHSKTEQKSWFLNGKKTGWPPYYVGRSLGPDLSKTGHSNLNINLIQILNVWYLTRHCTVPKLKKVI